MARIHYRKPKTFKQEVGSILNWLIQLVLTYFLFIKPFQKYGFEAFENIPLNILKIIIHSFAYWLTGKILRGIGFWRY